MQPQVTLKGHPVKIYKQPPQKGQTIPDFVLVDADLKDRSLKEFKGKSKIIYIAPSLDTPVCLISTKKLNDFAKTHPNTVVLIVTADLPFAQMRVCHQEDLKGILPLSMMRSKKFGEDYGVLIMDGPLQGICARCLVVVDEDDRVLYEELVPEIGNEPNYKLAFQAFEK